MKTKLWFAGFAVLIFQAGCVRSLQPLFTDNDVVFKPALVGTWRHGEDKETWTLRSAEQNGYTLLSQTERGDTVAFEAHLVQLGKYYFFDLLPKKEGQPWMKNDLYNFQLMPVHTFWRIWFEGDGFQAAMLDNEWTRKMIDENKMEIAYEQTGESIILTAPTKDLQLLVLKHADDEKAFPDAKTFQRVK